MRCSSCDSEHSESAKFCDTCGTPVRVRCPSCGSSNRPGARFCNECGATLGNPSVAANVPDVSQLKSPAVSTPTIAVGASVAAEDVPEGERKLVTVLFADIKGSTELEENLDPEEARALVDPALELMVQAVRRYDGYVVQSTGDGILALFGAPVAHEDHPQRALYAALRMQQELRRYSAKLREQGTAPLELRIGANTGEVVVRSIRTGSAHVEYTPIGLTTNLASRMEALAPTGSIAVTEAT